MHVNKLQRTCPEIQRPRIHEDERQINPARVLNQKSRKAIQYWKPLRSKTLI